MHFSVRSGSALLLIVGLIAPLAAQPAESPAPSAAPAPAPAAAEKSSASDTDTKLSVVLRSYSLLELEADRLKEANAKLTAEKTSLEARLAEAQAAMPLAAQTVALREQLRQTQAQMAAYAEENAQLKSRISLGASTPGRPATNVNQVPNIPIPAAFLSPPPAPTPPRTHVIVAGDTLLKISQTYYGTPSRWNEILTANRDALRDEKSLVIGRTLVIP